jgi:hypothetical protein
MDEMMQKLAKQMEADLFAAICGPARKQPQTAIRLRGNGYETVELDDAGNVIEPPPPCCRPWGGLHAPDCKTWGSLT